jgi:hypothetical protein
MNALKSRAGRCTARPGLESLEDRTLLSATLPTAAPFVAAATSQHAAAMQVQHLTPSATIQDVSQVGAIASYSYRWSVGPGPVITGDRGNTGSVAFATAPAGSDASLVGGPADTISVALPVTNSSASDASPDHYNAPFTLSLKIRDDATGAVGTLTFRGMITGTLSWDRSSLSVNFQDPTQQVNLGGHVYTVRLPQGHIHLPDPTSLPITLTASVQVSKGSPDAPPPPPVVPPVAPAAHYSHILSISTGALKGTNSGTSNGKSTGRVDITLHGAGSTTARLGGPAVALPLASVTSISSASTRHPDHYNKTFTIGLKIRDAASGACDMLTFKGTVTGTLSRTGSSLRLTFQGSATKQIKLGSHIYTVTLRTGSLHVPAPGSRTPALIAATVQVSNAPATRR